MKALAIDSAASCMIIAAKNENSTVTLSLDIGMKQSQKILSAIDYVLSQVELSPSELDFTTLTLGPGTFTGLRLSFSALKAIELAYNVPIYGIPSLDVYSYSFKDLDKVVISVIDAKKDQFFAAVYKNGQNILAVEDTTVEKIANFIKKINCKIALITGADVEVFLNNIREIDKETKYISLFAQPNPTDALFEMAQNMIEQKKEPLKDYDGPVYLRKSEAEIALENKNN